MMFHGNRRKSWRGEIDSAIFGLKNSGRWIFLVLVAAMKGQSKHLVIFLFFFPFLKVETIGYFIFKNKTMNLASFFIYP